VARVESYCPAGRQEIQKACLFRRTGSLAEPIGRFDEKLVFRPLLPEIQREIGASPFVRNSTGYAIAAST
jgi:hypothetical protein